MGNWKLDKVNVEKVVARLTNSGRKVDNHIVEIIYKNMFENKEFSCEYYGELVDLFTSTIWNYGAVE